MRAVTRLMIKKYELMQLKYDFMGYCFEESKELSFHHIILSRSYCKNNKIGTGFWDWNGAILKRDTAHDYLHLIERYDEDMFYAINSELIDENIKGYLGKDNIEQIDDILDLFEREYCGEVDKDGEEIIKEGYTRRLVKEKHIIDFTGNTIL